MSQAFRRYLQGLGQETLALRGQLDVVLALPQQPLLLHAVEHLHAEIAGKMIVADPRAAQRRILRAGAHAQVTGAGGKALKALQHAGDIGVGEAIVAVAALLFLLDQAAGLELRQMRAGGLRRDAGLLRKQRLVRQNKQDIELSAEGERFLAKNLQISADALAHPRRPVCKACLDWSERRHHLAGTLGAAIMTRFTELKWAARDAAPGSRVVNFSRTGEKRFSALFGDGE